jgi:N-acetylneuraminic acid mutarotase
LHRRLRLEELELRLAPASFTVSSNLQISTVDNAIPASSEGHAVVFFESAVADFQILAAALKPGTDGVVLDSGGDGLKEMAAFLANRHHLTSIGVVAHGAPGAVALGTQVLDAESLSRHAFDLEVLGSALAPGGELDLWSCDVAAGEEGLCLMRDLAEATGAGVAAAEHMVGATALGGSWQLDVRTARARGKIPFTQQGRAAFDEILGTWSNAASLATARWGQTATLLPSGKVLVVGGISNQYESSADLYDPVRNTWSAAASMAMGRAFHTATLLTDGKVLVAGGRGVFFGLLGQLASAELYDPVSDTWSAAGSMATARWIHTATLLGNGKVLITGGYGGGSSAELYDPASNTWSSAGSMANTRVQHRATLLATGKVLVAGGETTSSPGTVLSSAELYDPASNTWSVASSMATARGNYGETLLANGKVLVTGGDDGSGYLSSAELYDPVSNAWSAAASLVTGRKLHTATLLNNGQVLVAGGLQTATTPFTAFASAELYDPIGNTWSAAGSMAMERASHTATLLSNGIVLVTGGENGAAQPQSGAELYDPGVGVIDPSQSTIAVTPAIVPSGGTATITLTTRDAAGNPVTTGGLPFTFGYTGGTVFGGGTFSNLTDNHNGTYTAVFTGSSPVSPTTLTITATLNGLAAIPTTLTVTPAIPTTQFTITNIGPTSVTTGGTVTFTVTAEDSTGTRVPSFTGTVQLTSTDGQAALGGQSLATSYTFVPSDHAMHTFTVTLATPGTQSLFQKGGVHKPGAWKGSHTPPI